MRAAALFGDGLTQMLTQAFVTAPEPAFVDKLKTRAMAAMTVNVGIDFALHMSLLPTFLQPIFLVVLLGEPKQARTAVYGFIAERPQQILGDRPESKRTPFCVRLLSPELLAEPSQGPCERGGEKWEVEYSVREIQVASTLQAVEMDLKRISDATNSGRWEPML